jgi:two-component system LytT family response regulator
MIRTLIVDDEPLARTAIRNMLRHHADVEIAGECESGAEAVAAIASLSPSLLFLDVQMPEVDGFGVLQALDLRFRTSSSSRLSTGMPSALLRRTPLIIF